MVTLDAGMANGMGLPPFAAESSPHVNLYLTQAGKSRGTFGIFVNYGGAGSYEDGERQEAGGKSGGGEWGDWRTEN